MITQKTTADATYTLQTAGTVTARYHDGRTRRAAQVLVRNETRGSEYSVLVPVDGGTASCSCPGWKNHAHCRRNGCRHISMALGHLLAEAEAARPLSPAIAAALGTTAEESAKIEAEAKRQERLRQAELDRANLWEDHR